LTPTLVQVDMQSILKTVLGAAVVSAVTAGAVLMYVDHKVDEVTQAIVDPIKTTSDAVGNAVEATKDSITSAVDSTGTALSGAIESTGDALTGAVETTGNSVGSAFDSAAKAVDDVGDSTATALDGMGTDLGRHVMTSWISVVEEAEDAFEMTETAVETARRDAATRIASAEMELERAVERIEAEAVVVLGQAESWLTSTLSRG